MSTHPASSNQPEIKMEDEERERSAIMRKIEEERIVREAHALAVQTRLNHERATRLDIQWSRLVEHTNNLVVEHFRDKNIGEAYGSLLFALKHDRSVSGDTTFLGFRRAPASKNRHHDREGGLIEHLFEMWEIWLDVRAAIRQQNGQVHTHLNDGTVWKAILHHDLNKIWRYRLMAQDPWTVDYANDHDRITSLLGSTHKSLWLLNRHGISLSLPLHNALICAEGGFSEGPRPRTETVLAKVVYLLDELSANVVDRLKTNRFWDSKVGGINEEPQG